MKKINYLLISFIFILIGINLISAEANPCGSDNSYLGTFKLGDTITLKQTCDTCTYVNLSSVKFPNSSSISYGLSMDKDGVDYTIDFNYALELECYSYTVFGNKVTLEVETIDFKVTPTGEELTIAKGIVYIFLAILIFILFLFVLYVNIALPMGNEMVDGKVVKIIKKKYIKIGLIPVTYSLFVWFLNLLLSISNNLTGKFNIYSGMFEFLFSSFLSLSWVVWIVCFVWFMYNWIRDLNWNKQIKKFGRVIK